MYVCMYYERRGVQYVVGVLCWGMLSTHHDLVLYGERTLNPLQAGSCQTTARWKGERGGGERDTN